MTRYVPEDPTATNKPLPKVTDFQGSASPAVLEVQIIPSGDVMTWDVATPTVWLTAANKLLPKVTEVQ